MLDDNLPTFFLKAGSNGEKYQRNFFLTYHGSEQQPAYTLQYSDPASPSPAHKNCYAVALIDAFNPDVVYGEVLARPGWTQPSLSQEDIRRNGGVPPPPQPVLPTEFVIQLYNPDQQIRVELVEGKWGGSDSYIFSMPISTFRTPSASNLDRSQSDPASLAITPKVHFAWRKESKLGKDLTCFMTGKSTDPTEKKKSRRDPDIAIALWRSMREMTVYEPNLSRVDVEDYKGLEIVLLLSAVVIKDIFFTSKEHIRETFNIAALPIERRLSGGGRKLSSPQQISAAPLNPLQSTSPSGQLAATGQGSRRSSLPKLQTSPPPLADPRAQWELDAETARLKRQAEAEAREEARRRRAREKADEAEARRLQKQMEEEERAARRRQAEVDRETDRLRRQYGVQDQGFPPPRHSFDSRYRPQSSMQPIPQGSLAPPPPRMGSNGLYMQPSASSNALVMSGANPSAASLGVPGASSRPSKKKSFFGLRSASDDGTDGNRLKKKQSTMW